MVVTRQIVRVYMRVRRDARISRILEILFFTDDSDVEAGASVVLFRTINMKS